MVLVHEILVVLVQSEKELHAIVVVGVALVVVQVVEEVALVVMVEEVLRVVATSDHRAGHHSLIEAMVVVVEVEVARRVVVF
jgi:hypothetical protein